jgi:hypothetical protein
MEFEIDMDAVDHIVVGHIIMALCEAMLKADHIDPTIDECIIAFSRMIEMVIDSEHQQLLH